jgi:hypothetical protein
VEVIFMLEVGGMSERRVSQEQPGMPGDARKQLGSAGERLATERLRQAGYTIRAANHRREAGEIDLVAEEDGDIVFVEVRYPSAKARGL